MEKDKIEKMVEKGLKEMTLKTQLENEVARINLYKTQISNINVHSNDSGLVTFQIGNTNFWAMLTKTGKLKKNSIRIDL